MKRLATCAVVLGVVAPAMAEPTIGVVRPEATKTYVTFDALAGEITYRGSGRDAGGESKLLLYSDTMEPGYFFGAGTMVGDDIHEIASTSRDPNVPGDPPADGIWPSTITELTFGCYLYTSAPTTSFYVDVLLIDNPGGDDDGSLPGTILTLITGVGPLGQGLSYVTIDNLKIPTPSPDMWFLVDYSDAPGDPNGAPAGPLITDNPGGAVGYSHGLYWFHGTWWPPGPPGAIWADFYHEIRGVPEPMTIGLLVVGGLFALRRRRGSLGSAPAEGMGRRRAVRRRDM